MTNLSTLYTYACNDVRYERKDKPEAWTTADKVNGTMFRSYPLFEFIPGTEDYEPKRYGDFVLDIDTGELACGAAIKIIQHFEKVFNVDPYQWRCYLSGKKGVHLELPASILGTEDGHRLLTLGYKRLAKDIEGALQVKLDTSMYNAGTGKPYRQPNVMRETGTCKRQVEYDDLFLITFEDDYRVACSEPGKTWEPEDVGRNNLLAEKMAANLLEAEQQQDAIRNTPGLTDDEIDRLAIFIPACVRRLANTTAPVGNATATFNDIAIQLTAYAVTAKKTEQEFLDGCRVFISGYPSSSLTTLQLREENCRARYRSMAANGNQFSCAAIKALRFPGFDCDVCTQKPCEDFPATAILNSEELKQISTTLHIPEEVMNPGGLISLGMHALGQPGLPNIPQYNLPVVLTTIARAIAGKMIFNGVWPNVFNLKIGPTSSGKSTSDDVTVAAVSRFAGKGFYGVTDFSSGPALLRALQENPHSLIVIDEAASIFRRYEKADPVSDGKRDALLEVYSASGRTLRKAYANSKESIDIEQPCVSLTGNATPMIFEVIKQEDFDTGTMQRFDFWCYDGPIPRRGVCFEANERLETFAEGIADLYAHPLPGKGNLRQILGGSHDVGATPEAARRLAEWSDEIHEKICAVQGDGERGIIGRGYALAIKYALIHMAGTRPLPTIYEPMDLRDVEYGIRISSMLVGWKRLICIERVTTGDFHRRCEVFKKAILASMRAGKRPSFKTMMNRYRELKNWRRKESDEIIEILQKRGDIVVDESKRPTAYFLAKKTSDD